MGMCHCEHDGDGPSFDRTEVLGTAGLDDVCDACQRKIPAGEAVTIHYYRAVADDVDIWGDDADPFDLQACETCADVFASYEEAGFCPGSFDVLWENVIDHLAENGQRGSRAWRKALHRARRGAIVNETLVIDGQVRLLSALILGNLDELSLKFAFLDPALAPLKEEMTRLRTIEAAVARKLAGLPSDCTPQAQADATRALRKLLETDIDDGETR